MVDEKLLIIFMNSMKNPYVFADTNHIIQFMNTAAKTHYKEGESLIGTNVLDCHNAISQKIMLEIYEKFQNGLDEELITDNTKYRIYMRAVRDENGTLLGYYERYEPPIKKETDL